ncbi:hypothetical protein pb186bvf_006030 [Paramecium bursaria]
MNNYAPLNNVQQPINKFYNIVQVQPIPQAFYSLNNQLYYQNNQNLYRISNLELGTQEVLASFDMSFCPILYSTNAQQIYTFNYYMIQILKNKYNNGGGYLGQNLVYLYSEQQIYVISQNIYCESFLSSTIVEGFLQNNQEQTNYGSHFIISYYKYQSFPGSVNILVNYQNNAKIRFGPLVTSEITSISFGFTDQISQFKLNKLRKCYLLHQLLE